MKKIARTDRKSIPLRTFLLYKKSIIFIVRLSFKKNYERLPKFMNFYERFKSNNGMRKTRGAFVRKSSKIKSLHIFSFLKKIFLIVFMFF